jgi:hypothetical protein
LGLWTGRERKLSPDGQEETLGAVSGKVSPHRQPCQQTPHEVHCQRARAQHQSCPCPLERYRQQRSERSPRSLQQPPGSAPYRLVQGCVGLLALGKGQREGWATVSKAVNDPTISDLSNRPFDFA